MTLADQKLPKFAKRDYEKVHKLVSEILTPLHSDRTTLIQLMEFDDGHFRAIFKSSYFVISEGQELPSKSQWNTLKKKFKRHDRHIFVFKEHGNIRGKDASLECYLDFGFFAT